MTLFEQKISVLVVDDSLFIRTFLGKVLASNSEIGEIKMACDGQSAVAMLATYKPDIITLDVEMPKMDGLEALKIIKQQFNIPVIMVSSLTSRGADITIKALQFGAIDWIQKPDNGFNMRTNELFSAELISKIMVIARKDQPGVAEKVREVEKIVAPEKDNFTNERFKQLVKDSGWTPKGSVALDFHLIGIGVSTGGPSALNQVVPFLPENINAAVIIVQHMPSTFTKVLADRLNDISKIKVKEAEDGEVITKGVVYVVPGDKHIRIRENAGRSLEIRLEYFPKVGGFRPSAETLFYFLAGVARSKAIGIIMTGMGGDGSDNLGLVKSASNMTIAQDEHTSVIFGMPKMAIQKGNVNFVLPLNKIIDKIKELVH